MADTPDACPLLQGKYLYEVLGFTALNYEEKLKQAKHWVRSLKQAQQSQVILLAPASTAQGTAPTPAQLEDSFRVQTNSSKTCTLMEVDTEEEQAAGQAAHGATQPKAAVAAATAAVEAVGAHQSSPGAPKVRVKGLLLGCQHVQHGVQQASVFIPPK